MESELVATTREDDGAEDDGAEDDGAENDRAEDDRAENDLAEDDGAEDAIAELLCPICWELLHQPQRLDPCLHLFCDPCLRRLARARIHTCPICRSFITDCHLDEELQNFIENQHQDVYIQRQEVEMISGIFNEPLPPVRRTLSEIFNQWQEEWLTPDLLLVAMLILMWLLQFGFILMLNLIFDQISIHDRLRPIMRVLTIAKEILRLMAMIIQLNVQWLRSLAIPGEDQIQELQI